MLARSLASDRGLHWGYWAIGSMVPEDALAIADHLLTKEFVIRRHDATLTYGSSVGLGKIIHHVRELVVSVCYNES